MSTLESTFSMLDLLTEKFIIAAVPDLLLSINLIAD